MLSSSVADLEFTYGRVDGNGAVALEYTRYGVEDALAHSHLLRPVVTHALNMSHSM